MKKDLLLGLRGRSAVLLGLFIWLWSKTVNVLFTGNSLALNVVMLLEVISMWFFFVGLYRWYKENKSKKQDS